MDKKIDAWVDKKTVISVALGILLAAWLMWVGYAMLCALGVVNKHNYKKGMMRDEMHKKMMQDTMYMDDMGGAAGTFMEGTEIPTDIDTSAM